MALVLPYSAMKPGVALQQRTRPSAARCLVLPQARAQAVAQRQKQPCRRLPGAIYAQHGSVRRAGIQGAPLPSRLRSVPAVHRRPTPYVSAVAYRRGNTLVICASLARLEDAQPAEAAVAEAVVPPAPVLSQLELLRKEVEINPKLITRTLDNGFKYVIMLNKTPPERFEAHLEVHAGSVDERPEEQGVAHLVEHVTFLGSRKREALLGTGARANAYTDFHHTVFHVHSPLVNGITNRPMLPQILEALEEIAFEPQFAAARIEKERKAVLAEAQMMNTIEYRVDCQLLQHLHAENNLGCRFPIGKTEQVKTWPHDTLQSFWTKWYFPANATLYVVGDLDVPTEEVERLIKATFGRVPAGREPLLPAAGASNGAANALANGNGTAAAQSNGTAAAAPPPAPLEAPLKRRHTVRPPVVHRFGIGPLQPDEELPAKVNIFRHPLLQHFMLSIFCKLPTRSLTRLQDLRQQMMVRVVLSTFQFRVNARYVVADPPFTSIDLDISDSGREGCAVSTLTITSEPAQWRGAVQVAVQESRRLQRHGLTAGELSRYKIAMLRDSAQLAHQADSVPSSDNLDFLMESLALGHTVMAHDSAHTAMAAVIETISLEDVNAYARSLMAFASDYGREAEALEAAANDPEGYWTDLGPSRTTSIVACIPSYYTEDDGTGMGGVASVSRSKNLGAMGHLDADEINLEELEAQTKAADDVDIPEGASRFDLEAEEITTALQDYDLDVSPNEDVEVPKHLVPIEELEELLQQQQPRFVPLEGQQDTASSATPASEATGITQRRLSNGIRINYCHTDNEPKAAVMRCVANGGRVAEAAGTGPAGAGAISLGVRAVSESGTVGDLDRHQVEVFCITNLVDCILQAEDEFLGLDLHFAVDDGGMRAAFELLHTFLRKPKWDQAALDRTKIIFESSYRTVSKSLERMTADKVMLALLGDDRRFRDPSPEEIKAITLEGCRQQVMAQLHAGNLEVNVVGDFDSAELEELCLTYLGSIPPVPGAGTIVERPIVLINTPEELRRQKWHLMDSDERACAFIAGPAPCRWGTFGDYSVPAPVQHPVVPPPTLKLTASLAEKQAVAVLRRQHPLFSTVTLMLLTEVINSRLFTTVRDSLGLTYDVCFEVTMHDRMRTSWFSVNVTSYPDKIEEALQASLAVLREMQFTPVTPKELMRAKRTLLIRHESDLKDNKYWLGLLTHLQNPSVPCKTVDGLRDLIVMYKAITTDDLLLCYSFLGLRDDQIVTAVGTSGKAPPKELPQPTLVSDYGTEGIAPFDPVAMFTAIMTAVQGKKLAQAYRSVKPDQKAEQ